MAYTAKQLADLSGVSVRTLHFYDEIKLLKPAFVGANGYRYYEEEQLLILQQILFYRELEFDLREIERLLKRGTFDRVKALKCHREMLLENATRMKRLIRTVDETIETLSGGKKMKAKEMFAGFDAKKQAEHENYLIERYGKGARENIAESKRRIKSWTKGDWARRGAEWEEICQQLVAELKRERSADSREVQAMIGRHFTWLKHFWTPTKESYAGHAQFIVERAG
jgi:DNA-binding transcriptional MerR regulator